MSEVAQSNMVNQQEIFRVVWLWNLFLPSYSTKLTSIELRNENVENRLNRIEGEILSLRKIRGSIDTMESRTKKLDDDKKSVKFELKNLESNVSSLGESSVQLKKRQKQIGPQ